MAAVPDPAPVPLPEAGAAAAAGGGDPIRDRLIAAAAEVFAEKGFEGAGVAEIARRAGYTTGAIYGRFTGKAELLSAAIDAHTDNELDSLFNEHRFEGKVTDILTTVGSHLVSEPWDSGQALLLEAFVAARRNPELLHMVQGRLDWRADQLSALIAEAKASGAVDPDLDTEAVTRFCHAVGFGMLLLRSVDVDLPAAAPWEALIARLVDALDVEAQPPPTTTTVTDPTPEPDQ